MNDSSFKALTDLQAAALTAPLHHRQNDVAVHSDLTRVMRDAAASSQCVADRVAPKLAECNDAIAHGRTQCLANYAFSRFAKDVSECGLPSDAGTTAKGLVSAYQKLNSDEASAFKATLSGLLSQESCARTVLESAAAECKLNPTCTENCQYNRMCLNETLAGDALTSGWLQKCVP